MGRENRSTTISEKIAFTTADNTIDQTVIDNQHVPILENNDEVRPGIGDVADVRMLSEKAILTHSATTPLVNTTRENCPKAVAHPLCMCRANQKVKRAMNASPIPAGNSTHALPVIMDAAIPLMSAIIMQNGHGK
jgi:hypothetical protein